MINEKYAKKFCKDDISKIENYDKAIADTERTWDCHHRLELTLDGEFAHTRDELIRLGMYWNRPYFELIFLTHAEHASLHNSVKNPMYGKTHTEEARRKMSEGQRGRTCSAETRKKLSEASSGKKNGMYCKGYLIAGEKNHWFGKHLSEETRMKMSESAKGRIPWNKGKPMSEDQKKKLSESCRGRTPHNKGKPSPNRGKRLSKETRRRMSEAKKRYWSERRETHSNID